MKNEISKWANLKSCPLNSIDFAEQCRQKLSDTNVLLLHQFLLPEALNQIIKVCIEEMAERLKAPVLKAQGLSMHFRPR